VTTRATDSAIVLNRRTSLKLLPNIHVIVYRPSTQFGDVFRGTTDSKMYKDTSLRVVVEGSDVVVVILVAPWLVVVVCSCVAL
jgi:hypothetical protein